MIFMLISTRLNLTLSLSLENLFRFKEFFSSKHAKYYRRHGKIIVNSGQLLSRNLLVKLKMRLEEEADSFEKFSSSV